MPIKRNQKKNHKICNFFVFSYCIVVKSMVDWKYIKKVDWKLYIHAGFDQREKRIFPQSFNAGSGVTHFKEERRLWQ